MFDEMFRRSNLCLKQVHVMFEFNLKKIFDGLNVPEAVNIWQWLCTGYSFFFSVSNYHSIGIFLLRFL